MLTISREAAHQIASTLTSLGQFTGLKLLKSADGCSDIKKDIAFLHTQVHHVVVGTLDRLDFILK